MPPQQSGSQILEAIRQNPEIVNALTERGRALVQQELDRLRGESSFRQTPFGEISLTPEQQEKEQPGTGVLGGALETFPVKDLANLAVQSVKEGMNFFFNPDPRKRLESVRRAAQQGLSMGEAIGEQSQEQFGKAEQAFERAGYEGGLSSPAGRRAISEGVGRVGASVPGMAFLGEAGEAAGRGEFGRATGQAIGAFLPELIGGAAATVKPAKPVGQVAKTLGERTGNPVVQFGEAFAERTIGGRGPFLKFRRRQQGELIGKANEIADQISSFRGSNVELGQRIQEAYDQGLKKIADDFSAQYDAIDRAANPQTLNPLTGQAEPFRAVNQAPVKRFAQNEIERLRRVRDEGVVPDAQVAPRINELEQIVAKPDEVPFRVAHDSRSVLLDMADSGETIGNRATGRYRKMAALLGDAMEAGAKRVEEMFDQPGLSRFVKETNEQFAEHKTVVNKSVLKNIASDAAQRDTLHLLFDRFSVDDAKEMRRIVGEEVYNDAAARWFRDRIINRAVEGEELTASFEPIGGVTDRMEARSGSASEIQTIKGRKLEKTIEDAVGGERARAILGDKAVKDILQLSREARSVGAELLQSGGTFSPGLAAGIFNAATLGGIITFMATLNPIYLATGLSQQVTPFLYARLATKPEGLTALRGFVRAAGNKNARAMEFWTARALDALGGEQEVQRIIQEESQ